MILQEMGKLSEAKILIIQDDMMQQKIMSGNVSSYGYACEAASSGKEDQQLAWIDDYWGKVSQMACVYAP